MLKRRVGISLDLPYDDHQSPLFYGGAVLSGKVSFRTPTSDRLSSITVDFRGFSQVNGERVEVFHRRCELIKGGARSKYLDIRAREDCEFPFQITAPEVTGPDNTSFPNSSNLFDDSNNLLPQSLEAHEYDDANIVYEIFATVLRVSDMGGHRTHQPITHKPKILKCLSTAMSQQQQQHEHHRPLSAWFTQPMTPTNRAPFRAHESLSISNQSYSALLNIPHIVTLGQSLNIVLLVYPNPDTNSCRNLFTSILSLSLSATLVSTTHSQQSKRKALSAPPIAEMIALSLKVDADSPSTSTEIPVGIPQAFTYALPSSYAPSSRSHAISRTYKLAVDVGTSISKSEKRSQIIKQPNFEELEGSESESETESEGECNVAARFELPITVLGPAPNPFRG